MDIELAVLSQLDFNWRVILQTLDLFQMDPGHKMDTLHFK